ncbi:hypothetical protein CKAH01_09718 [Colletotrichum kahawae]|uniref:Uncharacterized protein n=1 Tax=Colletotrichum kahawae TaxID=34407 RepID=A0AAD9XZB3_COLKA|nr:hypothetical protein CKAH01_09718 [Colletotrichum kahawae]
MRRPCWTPPCLMGPYPVPTAQVHGRVGRCPTAYDAIPPGPCKHLHASQLRSTARGPRRTGTLMTRWRRPPPPLLFSHCSHLPTPLTVYRRQPRRSSVVGRPSTDNYGFLGWFRPQHQAWLAGCSSTAGPSLRRVAPPSPIRLASDNTRI